MPKGISKTKQQTIDFFENFIRRDAVQDFTIKLRREVGIPEKGILLEEIDLKLLSQDPDYFVYYIPYRIEELLGKNYEEIMSAKIKIIQKCISFIVSQGINSSLTNGMFLFYFIFNITPPFLPYNYINDDLINLEHLPSRITFYDGLEKLPGSSIASSKFSKTKHSTLISAYEHLNAISKKYPVAIYINPNISQRQLIDYISHNWNKIEEYRDDKLKFNKNRTKRRQSRNDFIYENKNLSLKKISALVSKYFPNEDADEGSIGKIISLENKKRN